MRKALNALIAAIHGGENYGDALCSIAAQFNVSRSALANAFDDFSMTDHEQ